MAVRPLRPGGVPRSERSPTHVVAAEAAIAPDAVLDALEAEAIHIFREAAGAFRRPVMLYSIGKDSSVLLHLAVKAFAPGKVPFPVLHIDTTWKFREMIEFRDRMAARARRRAAGAHQPGGRRRGRHARSPTAPTSTPGS